MVNPGAFLGTRFQFLLTQKAEWERAVQDGTTRETLLIIQRRYFKRYPIDLPHDVEPSEEHLAAVDDNAPDDDINPEELASQFVVSITGHKPIKRATLVKSRKNQIHRWLQYQYTKDHGLPTKNVGASNPYSSLITQLTGKDPEPPRKKSAANVWRKTQAAHDAIEQDFQREISQAQAKNKPIPKSQFITRRDRIARTLFNNLSKSERDEWELKALNAKKEAKAAYDQEANTSISTNPEDRQRAIQALPQVVMPILDLIAETTGWKATLMVGGPEPAQGGQLNVISVHSGTTAGDIPINFGQSERERYKEFIVPIFGSFLKKCYSPGECRSRALPRSSELIPLSILDPGTEDEPHGLGADNPRAFIHPVETGLELEGQEASTAPAHDVEPTTEATEGEEDIFPFRLRDDADWPASEYTSSPHSSPAVSRCGTPLPDPQAEHSSEQQGVELRRRLPPPGLIITTDDNFTFPASASAEEQDAPVMYLPSVQFVTAGGYTSLHATPQRPTNSAQVTRADPHIDPALASRSVNEIIQSAISSIPLRPASTETPTPAVSVIPGTPPSHPVGPIQSPNMFQTPVGVVTGPNITQRPMVDFVFPAVSAAPAIPHNGAGFHTTGSRPIDQHGNHMPPPPNTTSSTSTAPHQTQVLQQSSPDQLKKRKRTKSEKALAMELEGQRKRTMKEKGAKKANVAPPGVGTSMSNDVESTPAPGEPAKGGRGCPVSSASVELDSSVVSVVGSKRGRGRPRKSRQGQD